MNIFNVTPADGRKLMAFQVRWDRRARAKKQVNMVMAAQVGDNCIPGPYKLKIHPVRQIQVWWILCFSSPSFLPTSHILATTSIASLIQSHASYHYLSIIVIPSLSLVCHNAKSVILGLWRVWVPWLWVHARTRWFCWSQTQILDAQDQQTVQLGSHIALVSPHRKRSTLVLAWNLPIGLQRFTCFSFFLSSFILKIFLKTFQTDSVWAKVFLMNEIKGPH